jgi:phosphoglycerate dehydrogenase-like enzyme
MQDSRKRTLLLAFEPEGPVKRYLPQIKGQAPEMGVVVTRDRATMERTLKSVEIAAGAFPRELLARASQLRWLQQWGAGADWLLDMPQAADMDVIVTSASGVHAIPISEHIMAVLLAFARRIPQATISQKARTWARANGNQTFELRGKTMLLVGVGSIGRRTAGLAKSFGMQVLGVRRNPSLSVPGVDAMYGPREFPDLLPYADFVVLTIPLTKQTQNLVSEKELRAMKPTARLVNIGRGGTVHEEALIKALREGWIAGAALDVFATEPLPESSPLWDTENLIITSHYSGATPLYWDRAVAIFLENLHRYRTGQPLRNVVNKELGY